MLFSFSAANQDASDLQDQIYLFQPAFSFAQWALFLLVSHSICIKSRRALPKCTFLPKTPSQKFAWGAACPPLFAAIHPTQADLLPAQGCPCATAPVLFWESSPERHDGKLAFWLSSVALACSCRSPFTWWVIGLWAQLARWPVILLQVILMTLLISLLQFSFASRHQVLAPGWSSS